MSRRVPAGRRTDGRALFALATVLLLAGGPGVQAGDEHDQLATRVEVLVRGLESTMGAARRDAAEQLAKLGIEAVPHLLPHLPLAGGTAGDLALREAISRMGDARVLGMLLAHRTRWQVGDPDAAALLVEELWLALRADAAERAQLTWSRLRDPSVVPRDLVVRVEEALPASLAGRKLSVEARGESLIVHVGEEPRDPVTLTGRKPRLLELGDEKAPRPVVIWRLADRWYAAPAAVARCVVLGQPITLLDGDLDGRLQGAVDRVRIGSGGFQTLRRGSLSWIREAHVRLDVTRGTDGNLTLHAVTLPLPAGLDAGQRETFAALNRWRRGNGLGAQYPELPRCEACNLHARYYEKNGCSGHDESAAKPGYTEQGAYAGQASCCSPSSAPSAMVQAFAQTILHRCCLVLGAAEPGGVGIGSGGGCVWSGPVARPPPTFVLVPSPGQREVPLLCGPETPPSDSEPTLYGRARGYPVSVSMLSGFRGLQDPRIEMHPLDRPKASVAGFLFSPRRPYNSGFGNNKSTVHFVAKRPLRGGTTYCARFTAYQDETPLEVVWTFTTR